MSAEYGEHSEIVGRRELDLGAQFEASHARYEFIGAPLFTVEDHAIVDFGEAKIVQIFALRCEESAIGGVRRRNPIDILRNQSLEKRLPVGAPNRHQPAI